MESLLPHRLRTFLLVQSEPPVDGPMEMASSTSVVAPSCSDEAVAAVAAAMTTAALALAVGAAATAVTRRINGSQKVGLLRRPRQKRSTKQAGHPRSLDVSALPVPRSCSDRVLLTCSPCTMVSRLMTMWNIKRMPEAAFAEAMKYVEVLFESGTLCSQTLQSVWQHRVNLTS